MNDNPNWLLLHLPSTLLQRGFYGLFWWQWVALALLLVVASVLGSLLSRLTRRLLGALARRTSASWDDVLVARLTGPLSLGWMLLIIAALRPWLGLHESARGVLSGGLRAGVLIVLFWGALRLVDIARENLLVSAWTAARPGARSMLPLATRMAKLFVLAVAVVALLSELGYPVTSLVAGLGIGGVAVALGAQKTFENLFGAFSISADQPFREGDFVRIEDFVGTVEAIGLRSTRIRTLDRTIISLPNGKLADMRVETFAVRDRLRLACTLGLVYGTSAAQIRAVISGVEKVLREHPKLWTEAVIVRFKEFGESSLNIEVMAWFTTSDWGEFLGIRENVLLRFMEVVEREGSSFAFPTRTLHLVQESNLNAAGTHVRARSSRPAPPRPQR